MKATDKIRQTLIHRDREIAEALAKLASQADALRAEQSEVHRDMKALGIAPDDETAAPAPVLRLVTRAQLQPLPEEVQSLSNKEAIQKAFAEYFPTGATKGQLIELFESWGRNVNSNVLSVQLDAMKHVGELENKNRFWRPIKQEGPDE